MRKELYYTLYEAEYAADVFASDHDGLVVGMAVELLPLRGAIQADGKVDYTDPRYSEHVGDYPDTAEVEAVRVVDKSTHGDIALFGYLEDEID